MGAIVVVAAVCIGAVAYTVSAYPSKKNSTQVSASSQTKTGTAKAKTTKKASASSASLTPTQIAASHLPAVQVSLADAVKPLWVHVQLSTQNVVVYDAKNRVVEAFVCSSGAAGSDTPTGTFTVSAWEGYPERGTSFYNAKYKEGAYYYVRFNQHYLFHSVPFDENRQIIPAQFADLGEPSSNGCIHLSMDNAKWIYDNIPSGTKVVVE